MAVGGTRVVQITNIAPQATKDQMQTLFGYLGKIDDIRLYPTIRDVSCPVQSRICYVKFMDSCTVGIAQHMTNTVFIDRALIVIPVQNGEIPDEHKALEMTNNGTIVPGLYPAEPKLPPNVVNSVEGIAPNQVIQTRDPHLEANGLPAYPPLPATYDSRKIEEVRRTIIISNYDSSTSSDEIIDFFSDAGEVKYTRLCTRSQDGSSHALVEFTEQQSIIKALKLNGRELKGRVVSVNHATQAIVKPQAKSNEAAQREIEEAMTRVKEAQSLISAAIDPVIGMLSKEKHHVLAIDLDVLDHDRNVLVPETDDEDLNPSKRRSASPKSSKRRSRSRELKSSRDKKKEKKERKEKDHEKENSDSGTKVPRNYDEEEKGFDSEKETDKNGDSKNHESHDESSQDSGNRPEKESSEKSDNMDISNSP
ncbi:Splicing regulatory protein 54 [Carabus blaptoides fortunei]